MPTDTAGRCPRKTLPYSGFLPPHLFRLPLSCNKAAGSHLQKKAVAPDKGQPLPYYDAMVKGLIFSALL